MTFLLTESLPVTDVSSPEEQNTMRKTIGLILGVEPNVPPPGGAVEAGGAGRAARDGWGGEIKR